MWNTMPKTNGRVDKRSLRYIAHRYFMQTSSLMVRGFEPTRSVNNSDWGAADILSQMVPAYVESVLESKHREDNGFTMQDVVDMVLTLDQLIFDSESSLLENVFKHQKRPRDQSLSLQSMGEVLEEYMITWMVDASPEDQKLLLSNRSLASQVLPHFEDLMKFAKGRAIALQYARQQSTPKGKANNALTGHFSFDDAHQVVGGITRNFQSYWQSECNSMKNALVSMDKHGTGRVPLSLFYNTALDSDWRFGESEAYLRELGALDESSKWRGASVIIPNYLQATSNCIVSTPHYLVCCVNECETLLGEIESAIQAPMALPSTILTLVRNMTSQTSLDDDEPAHLDSHMLKQLDEVAKNHGGMVPLHGRLFAQWLHFVFPRECPFPHKTGVVSALTPSQYGDSFIASKDDMAEHASRASDMDVAVNKDDLQWMSQWSPDEELSVDYGDLNRSWQWHLFLVAAGLLLAAAGFYGGVFNKITSKKIVDATPTCLHSHYV